MTTKTQAKTHHRDRLRLAGIAAGAALALAQADPFATIMQGRAEALRRLEAVLAKGETSITELRAILPLLEWFAMRLLEDAIGCACHVAGGGISSSWRRGIKSLLHG